ncbi:hypothetical protein H6P81_012985 [Aristolochia fimbriata]|uniref:FRIGIDA-like protein n=1 Tax=Aristolochia fimbriata TaxID=158543 RepID=A0AAV7EDE0_ARIFI|nr:hypothetical protein H6P81_012985 [Aristolochia fimbriata]
MEDTQSVATLIDSTTSKIQQLQQAFAELECHRAISLNLKWKELEEHFHGLERSLKKRFNELESQEKEYKTKALEAREMLEKQEALVYAKEQASLERLQEKRDAALSAIGQAFEKYKSASGEPNAGVLSDGHADAIIEEHAEVKASEEVNLEVKFEEENKPPADENMEEKPQTPLTKLCVDMDANGLHKFISDNRKNLAAIREEVPFALKSASDPARLVLESLEDFYTEIPTLDGKRDPNLLGLRRTCIMLMECLGPVLANAESDSLAVSFEIREKAKEIAEAWKPKLDELDIDGSAGNSLEVHAFLQLLATFGIASEFDKDDICKLIPSVARRRQTADLCRTLELQDKMPGVIDILINSGRQIEAVNMAYAFELTEQFAPVPLLKSYLKDARKTSQIKAGNASPSAAQNEANERELAALKAVMKCIEEHKLEDQYPVEPLQKRVLQLEKAKADKKRAAEAAKPQPKRPRANGVNHSPRPTNIPDKSFYRAPDRYPYMYDRPYLVLQVHLAPWVIADRPRFPFRGLLIDTARHYLPLPFIKKVIDAMAYTKLNVLHWHIVDSQSFPLEIPTYSKLWDGAYSHSERYTMDDAAEIVIYVERRGINVLAGLDVPGHARSWGYGYPSLWPSSDCQQPLDVSNEFTFQVISGILSDFRKVFKFKFVHLGGDEVNTSCWRITPHIRQWLKQQKMNESEAYQYFVLRAQKIAESHGYEVVNWEETFNEFGYKLSPQTVVHSWLGGGVAERVVAAGLKCIVSNQDKWYLDHLDTPWQDFYMNEPLTNITEPKQKKLVIGGEVCMWGETVDASDLEQTIWPRAAAAAERLWTTEKKLAKDPREVTERLAHFRCLQNERGIAAAPLGRPGQTAPHGPGSCFTVMGRNEVRGNMRTRPAPETAFSHMRGEEYTYGLGNTGYGIVTKTGVQL